MFENNKKILEEKLNNIITKLEILYSKRDTEKVNNMERTLSANSSYNKAKRSLKVTWINLTITVILFALIIIALNLVVSTMLESLPIIAFLLGVCLSAEDINDIRKYKKQANFSDPNLEEKLNDSKELVKELEESIAKFESVKKQYTEEIESINELPKKIKEIMDKIASLSEYQKEDYEMKDFLIDEFQEFLNEKIDYTHVHLDVGSDIKEYELTTKKQ